MTNYKLIYQTNKLDHTDKTKNRAAYLSLVKYINQLRLRKLNYQKNNLSTNNRIPFIIGISGSVAVGKTTSAKILKQLFHEKYPYLKVQVVATDGFIYSNKILEQKKIMDRKGFPESYDMELLNRFLKIVSSGKKAYFPIYSQKLSDIVSDKMGCVENTDVLILEGINTLKLSDDPISRDYLDFSIYIDAEEELIETWFLDRFKNMLKINRDKKDNFFFKLANIPLEEAVNYAKQVWQTVDLVNLKDNIEPSKANADMILHKTTNHIVDEIYLV